MYPDPLVPPSLYPPELSEVVPPTLTYNVCPIDKFMIADEYPPW